MKLFIMTIMNGLTLAALYFLVASGFTLVFGLMRNVNLAHGSLYLLGAYIGFDVAEATGSWLLGAAAVLAQGPREPVRDTCKQHPVSVVCTEKGHLPTWLSRTRKISRF